MQINFATSISCRIAELRSRYRQLALARVAKSAYHRLTRRIFLIYRAWLSVRFRVRNSVLRMLPISVCVDGVEFVLHPRGEIAFNIWTEFQVERRELDFVLHALSVEAIFFDIGANVGLFTLAAGQKLRTNGGRVYAFEPCSETFEVLQQNVHLNGLRNVNPVHAALTDWIGEGTLHVNKSFRDGLNTLGTPSHFDCSVIGSQVVPTTTIDHFMKANEIGRVDVMKVDVEGAELLVFAGGRRLLERNDAPVILYEGYSWCTAGFNYHPVEIMWLMKDFGYELFIIDPDSRRLVPRIRDGQYDIMIIAMKRGDPRFGTLLKYEASR